MPPRPPGRRRDPAIEARVVAVAARHLAREGYEGLSLAAVAREAGTTRQAVYRRWPTKASLAAAVLDDDTASAASAEPPLHELIAELTDFQRGVSRPGRLSLVGTMLQDSTPTELRTQYQARVVAPRRARLHDILVRAQQAGELDPDADLEIAVTMCTGSWYGRALAGSSPPPDWPIRTAQLVWRALGGQATPPAGDG